MITRENVRKQKAVEPRSSYCIFILPLYDIFASPSNQI
jgi:hypothetical protein